MGLRFVRLYFRITRLCQICEHIEAFKIDSGLGKFIFTDDAILIGTNFFLKQPQLAENIIVRGSTRIGSFRCSDKIIG